MASTLEVPWTVFDPPLVDPGTGALFTAAKDDLEWFNADAAAAELHAVCADDTAADQVVVSLGEERYVDLRGLRVLVAATDHARDTGRALVVLRAPTSLRRMVEVLGLESRINLTRVVPLRMAVDLAVDLAMDLAMDLAEDLAGELVRQNALESGSVAEGRRPRRRTMRTVGRLRLRPWGRLPLSRRSKAHRADR
jgi:anti-anti-sigma regulatory factor